MGRHSTGGSRSFYRSATVWLLPWVLVAVVAIAAVWIAVDALGNDVQPKAPPTPPSDATEAAGATEGPSPEDVSPTPDGSAGEGRRKEREKLITEGISVQILDGSGIKGAADHYNQKLTRLGYEVAAVNRYLASERSTVYWSSDGSKDAAKALAAKLGWDAEEKPSELSSEVSLHVLVGADGG